MKLIFLAIICATACAADPIRVVTQADVDAAGKAYADTVRNYYAGLMARARVPSRDNRDPWMATYDEIAGSLRSASQEKVPMARPLRYATLDYMARQYGGLKKLLAETITESK